MLTTRDARLVAMELYKLMKSGGMMAALTEEDEFLKTKEAAALLNRSLSWMEHEGHRFPRKKFGNGWLYSKSGLLAALNQ